MDREGQADEENESKPVVAAPAGFWDQDLAQMETSGAQVGLVGFGISAWVISAKVFHLQVSQFLDNTFTRLL
jgi:hypothetical protein